MIDLRSDTVTKPSPAMREAMATAPVGDDVYGEDPTVNRLENMAATLLGKTAAVFVPSGVMANQVSIRTHTQAGDEVIADSRSHIVRYESGASPVLSGVQLCSPVGNRGILSVEQVEAAIRPKDLHNPPTTLICLEQTHNNGGGALYPLTVIERIASLARARGIAMHLDGARLFNAVVATGVAAANYAQYFDTVSFCLSKGLGAPVGSLIVSATEKMDKLRRFRKMFGGGMRQAGILAAAGIYALEHNISRLKEDHDNAKRLAKLLQQIPNVSIDIDGVETNIVIFDIVKTSRSSATIVADLKHAGLLLNAIGDHTFRVVTHLDVTATQIEEAGHILATVLSR